MGKRSSIHAHVFSQREASESEMDPNISAFESPEREQFAQKNEKACI